MYVCSLCSSHTSLQCSSLCSSHATLQCSSLCSSHTSLQVLVEWSIDKYEAQFSTYRDNIGGRSFEKHFTVELPIDVVYTWVNGTDPILLRELNQLKREMRQKLEKEKLANQKKNGTADDQQKADMYVGASVCVCVCLGTCILVLCVSTADLLLCDHFAVSTALLQTVFLGGHL